MNYSLAQKNISIGGKVVITDWRHAKVVSPENLQKRIGANDGAKREIKKQKEVVPTSRNIALSSL